MAAGETLQKSHLFFYNLCITTKDLGNKVDDAGDHI